MCHRADAVSRARQLVEILPPDTVMRILRYLIGSYWQRYTGWPDLLVYNDGAYFLCGSQRVGRQVTRRSEAVGGGQYFGSSAALPSRQGSPNAMASISSGCLILILRRHSP